MKTNYLIDVDNLFNYINSAEKMIIIDVRNKEAFEEEHIPRAINIPFETVSPEKISQFDKQYLYIIYGENGDFNDSSKMTFRMLRMEFKVRELIGGIKSWKCSEYKTTGTEVIDDL